MAHPPNSPAKASSTDRCHAVGIYARTVTDALDPVEALVAIEAIKRLKATYFRCMDTKDWAGMREVFTDEVLTDTTESGGGIIRGGDEFIESLQLFIADVVTVHHGHMPEIQLTSVTTATGVWAMEDMLRWPNGLELHGFGHYHETYEQREGSWRIASMTLTRLRTDVREGPTT